ncbi:MAG: cyclic nucleotide-binding domain-containing protein [Pseudomonadota bacterium]|nr:cyclic nucleotide-binding domain-containing protein [Pseudomonadota bacterium]
MGLSVELFRVLFPQLLEGLQPAEAEALVQSFSRLEMRAGEAVIAEHTVNDAAYLLWEGEVACVKSLHGHDLFIGAFGPGRIFGESHAVEPGEQSVTMQAVTHGTLLRLRHADLERLGETQPRIAGTVLRVLSLEMAKWLRTFEEYMSGRTQLNNIGECIAMVRQLHQLKEK